MSRFLSAILYSQKITRFSQHKHRKIYKFLACAGLVCQGCGLIVAIIFDSSDGSVLYIDLLGSNLSGCILILVHQIQNKNLELFGVIPQENKLGKIMCIWSLQHFQVYFRIYGGICYSLHKVFCREKPKMVPIALLLAPTLVFAFLSENLLLT